ncbi:MAG TPA: hypothetical protein VJ436_13710 [Anaerolineales bacterium]|nr:hypothetical protein [Anaerolineales bacterium]
MPNQTLLHVIQKRFDVPIDPDSNGGQILNKLEPLPPFNDALLTGRADAAPMTFIYTSGGVSVRAAQGSEALVFGLPAGPLEFTLVPPDPDHPDPQVELKLLSVAVPLPFLRPALVEANGTLKETTGKVELRFPNLMLVITASTNPPASARLRLSGNNEERTVTMAPSFALIGPGTSVGFHFEQAQLNVDGTGELEILVSNAEIFLAPPGVPALAVQISGEELRLGLGVNGGLTGDFSVSQNEGQTASTQPPSFLSDLQWRVSLARNLVTAFEVRGTIDFQQAAESRLGGVLPAGGGPAGFELLVAFDRDELRTRLVFKSNAGAALWQSRRGASPEANTLLNILGLLASFAPLLNPSTAGGQPRPGDFTSLALNAGLAAALAASGLLETQSVALHGGELFAREKPDGSLETILMLDCQVDLVVQAKIGGVSLVASKPDRPLKVRHQAIGLRLNFGADPDHPTFDPVFDPGKGYALEISDPGVFHVPGPLGEILQVLGARLARTNPLNLEIDLGLPADLGVVSIDRARLRVPITDLPALPSITALGASLNLGALRGRGYLSLGRDAQDNAILAGSLDLTLVPLGVRIAAGLALANIPQRRDTAVLVTLGVEFPVPIPLYTSGLGIFGFNGLFAMHYRRDENPALPLPALDWYEHRAQGNPARLEAWKPEVNRWAFGLGSVLGTLEGGFVFNMNGLIAIELPGPRLLIFMGARLLSPPPGLKEKSPGNLLAVIDISDTAIRIGITANYSIEPILDIHIPASAFFPYSPAENFELDLGSLKDPITVKFLFYFRGSGYLMIHGNGIQGFPLGDLHGFSVAAGAHASFTWGLEDIGLYLRVSAGLDVGISFTPFTLLGQLSLSGELHLFIIGIEVSARPQLTIVEEGDDWRFYIKAPICGKVEFFFFDVEGCVTLELGDPNLPLPPAPPLVRALSLHSRSPALVEGTATDRLVDGSLGEAAADPATQPVPEVPIDSIPVLQFEMPPGIDPACQPFGQPLPQHPLLPQSGWTRRGERFYRYTLRSIIIDGPVGAGEKPSVWWHRQAKPGGDDNDVQLALLNWIPDPTPQAVLRNIHQERSVIQRWGTVCVPVAEPAPVLWTFHDTPLGTSASGWPVTGLALPDAAGFQRSAPPALRMRVTEPWRTGDLLADALLGVTPARVLALEPNPALPGQVLRAPFTPGGLHPHIDDELFAFRVDEAVQQANPFGDPLEDALRLSLDFTRYVRLLIWWMPELPIEHLSLRALDATGQPLMDPLDFDLQFTDFSNWLHSSHPGVDDHRLAPWVEALSRAAVQLFTLGEDVFLLLTADLPEGTAQVEIGLRDMTAGWREVLTSTNLPAYFLLAVEALPEGEVLRSDYDETVRDSQIKTIDGALGADPAKQALLRSNQTYTVRVEYTVQTGEEAAADDQRKEYPSAVNSRGSLVKIRPSGPEVSGSQRFAFRTDDQPPARLDPWLLCMDPSPDEGFHFWGDPIKVVFGTNAVRQLYAEYGRKLRGVVRAASSRHASGNPGFPQTQALLQPIVGLASLVPVLAFALSPWEESARLALRDLECVPSAHQLRLAHERFDLNLLLDPLTDYIFDIEAEPGIPRPSDQPVQPLFRRAFTTSRYQNLAEMMSVIAAAPLRHRRLPNPHRLLGLAALSAGQTATLRELEIEKALLDSGWGGLQPVQEPSVTVIWSDGNTLNPQSQPVGLLLDLPEPLWRWRLIPQKEIGSDPNKTERYVLRREAWLELVEIPSVRFVHRFIYTPGGGRTLVIFQPGILGVTVEFAIRKTLNETLDGATGSVTLPLRPISLAGAPWEAGA